MCAAVRRPIDQKRIVERLLGLGIRTIGMLNESFEVSEKMENETGKCRDNGFKTAFRVIQYRHIKKTLEAYNKGPAELNRFLTESSDPNSPEMKKRIEAGLKVILQIAADFAAIKRAADSEAEP